MVKCEVIVDRVSLVVGRGSIVLVDEKQFELARQFIKPINDEAEEKPTEEKPKRKSKK